MSSSQAVTPNIKRVGNRLVVSHLQHGWLDAMGVEVPWIVSETMVTDKRAVASPAASPVVSGESNRAAKTAAPVVSAPAVTEPAAPATVGSIDLSRIDLSSVDLVQLSQTVQACERCGLCEGRQQAVPGDGVTNPSILIVGEAPGEQEDSQGKPFVGRSGQLLANMMAAIGHGRDTSVFITNVVKCRPPANRNPRDEEIAACAPFLARQIELLAPQAILAMGRFAAHALLNTDSPLQQLRQTTHAIDVAGRSLPVVVTYHPAYLLRRPVDKRLAWEDLKRIKALVALP